MKENEEEVQIDNLILYNKMRSVPVEACKKITAGRLNGFTDINPMWRIKMLTEQFGVCGIGWKIEIIRIWVEDGSNGERTANVHIKLFVKIEGKWSEGIEGIGGSALVVKETAKMYTSDECFKMAYTDAISVACKMLGIGADVYFQKDRTKYDQTETTATKNPTRMDVPEQKNPEQKYASEPPRLTWTKEAVTSAIKGAKTITDLTTAWNNSDAETQIKLKKQFSEKRKGLTHA
jgi:hypothetical protein